LFDFTMSQRPSLRAQYPNLVFVDREDNPKCSSLAPERQLTNLKGDLVVSVASEHRLGKLLSDPIVDLSRSRQAGAVLGALRTAQA
jgi:hypothetical protein